MLLKHLRMGTVENSCWPEAVIFCSKKLNCGRRAKEKELILFREYPDIKKAYYLSMRLGLIYHQAQSADIALTRLAHWYDQVDKSGFLSFGTVARTIQTHYLNIVGFFKRRSTNAASESFNAKIKAFRAQLRGVRDIAFFLFRLTNIYA